jgi:hypothetical protein
VYAIRLVLIRWSSGRLGGGSGSLCLSRKRHQFALFKAVTKVHACAAVSNREDKDEGGIKAIPAASRTTENENNTKGMEAHLLE